jgi:hypothetical protein
MLTHLVQDIKDNSLSYGGIPFWSWNGKLEEEELRRQIRNMHDMNMNGFFMHARSGLLTEYMSEEWYNAVNVCIDEAKKLGMEAWAYDENGWPSGFAGGKLLEDSANFARFLKYTVINEFPTDGTFLAVYVITDNKAKRVIEAIDGVSEYHVITVGEDNSYVDILNKDVIAKFIKETHEEYKKRIAPEDFGSVMPGFFTDEPQYYRYATPWSPILADEFRKRYGYDIMDNLVALFLDCEDFRTLRYDYHQLIADLYIDSFAKQIYDWCEKNGCQLTGHSIEERSLNGQMMCAGSVMRFYCYEHIPGIDWLGRNVKDKHDMMTRQLGSACAQLGKKKALTETFACCGWDALPRELKNIADFQYVGGANVTCQHLYPYSSAGERKHDYPLHFSDWLPWQKHLAAFNEYYNHLGYVLSRGEENVRTLVIHPIHDAYMYFIREKKGSVDAQDISFRTLSDKLSENQIAYHYGDEDMMSTMAHVEGASITVGECTYDRVLIPKMETLTSSTVALLREYAKNGGKIILADGLPTLKDARPADYSWLKANMTLEELYAEQALIITQADGTNVPDLRVMSRIIDGKRVFFVTNIAHEQYHGVSITAKDCQSLVLMDILSLKSRPVHGEKQADGSFRILCNIADSEAFLLVEDDSRSALPLSDFCAEDAPVFQPPKHVGFASKPENTLTLDTVSYSTDGKDYSEQMPLMALRDELFQKRYRGDLYIRHSFNVEQIPASLCLACEDMRYLSLTVNGTPITLTNDLWRGQTCFRTVDILPYVNLGENEIVYKIDYFQDDYVYYVLYGGVSETLRNCLLFDTELAESYLYGDFAVRTDKDNFTTKDGLAYTYSGTFDITESRDGVSLDNVICDGLPFFAGALNVAFTHTFKKGEASTLEIKGRYAVCEVICNGKQAGTLLFGDRCDLSDYLKEGENQIELTLYNSNRNLLGPLHHPQIEPITVSPRTFTCETQWKNRTCVNFLNDRYCFVRFGVECE